MDRISKSPQSNASPNNEVRPAASGAAVLPAHRHRQRLIPPPVGGSPSHFISAHARFRPTRSTASTARRQERKAARRDPPFGGHERPAPRERPHGHGHHRLWGLGRRRDPALRGRCARPVVEARRKERGALCPRGPPTDPAFRNRTSVKRWRPLVDEALKHTQRRALVVAGSRCSPRAAAWLADSDVAIAAPTLGKG